jgi:hypothetical protein
MQTQPDRSVVLFGRVVIARAELRLATPVRGDYTCCGTCGRMIRINCGSFNLEGRDGAFRRRGLNGQEGRDSPHLCADSLGGMPTAGTTTPLRSTDLRDPLYTGVRLAGR